MPKAPPLFLFYKVVGLQEAVIGQNFQKKLKGIKRERGEKFPKLGTFSKKGPKFYNIQVFKIL